MAYSLETSSVKTIVPGAEVSGFCDVVARQKINELSGEVPQLSAGEGIDISTVDGKTVITNNISAGSNISLVYDMETNTYRIDSTGGTGGANYTGVAPIVVDNNEQIISADVWEFSAGNGLKFTDDNVNKMTKLEVDGNDLYSGEGIIISSNDNNQTRILLDQEWLNNQVNLSNYYKKTETSSKTELTNAFNNLNIDGLNMSASTNIDMFESGGYIVISANGGSEGGEYVPLSAKNCTIGDSNSAGIGDWGNTATNSFAQGDSNSAFAHSFTQGNGNSACWQSMAQGERNISFNQSMTQGTTNSAVEYSQALGDANTANKYSFAAGNRNFASRYSQALGYKLNISGGFPSGGMAIGSCNKLSSDVSFVIGNGTSTANRSDAFVIYPDGRVSAAGKISANGVELGAGGGSTFPITGTNGTTGFTANMDCSSMMLTTGASPAGGYVKQTVRGVQYEAYPATDVSASWYNIINATNNRSNCYCIRFTNDMTAASLEDYSAYDKVTVVHSNEYTPDCMLYWDGNTKVFPSGLYCELVKGTNDQNQTDWFFTTSGWINNVEWDWD